MFGVSLKKIESWARKQKGQKLVKAASNSNKEICLAAIKAMGSVSGEEVYNFLIASLRSPDPEIKIACMESLGQIGKASALEHVKSLKNDQDEKVKEKAAEIAKKLTGR